MENLISVIDITFSILMIAGFIGNIAYVGYWTNWSKADMAKCYWLGTTIAFGSWKMALVNIASTAVFFLLVEGFDLSVTLITGLICYAVLAVALLWAYHRQKSDRDAEHSAA